MNDIFNDSFTGDIYNYANRRAVNRMEEKLTIIMDKIDNETNSEYIFSDYKIYTQVINLLEEIDQIWHTIKNHTRNMDNTYYTLIQIEDLIDINNKYYDGPTS